tara:strand:- start:1836 stop:2660 length:825 start_codon:yes stop_codon:yes gene_type:complete
MAVITISRQFASHGDQIADAVSARLGHRLVDKHTIEARLHRYGVKDDDLVRYDERRPGIWAGLTVDRDRYAQYLRLGILDEAREGSCVILGRGGHSILGGIPGIVTVRVVAPQEVRHARAVEHFGASDDQADRMVHHNDREREGFHRSFFGCDWTAPEQYTVTINSGVLDTRAATDVICSIHEQMEATADQPRTRQLIEDRWIATRVAADIQFGAQLMVRYLDVQVTAGRVALYGVVTSTATAQRCAEIAAAVPGVDSVENGLQEMPDYIPPII